MKRIKRLLSIGIMMILVIGGIFPLTGCEPSQTDSSKDDGKYDVSIRIASDDGELWTFTPDIEEMHIERAYDGQEHRYYVHSYQLVDHPRWPDTWISPDGEGANVFQSGFLYGEEEGKYYYLPSRKVKEKGYYCMTTDASATSSLWHFRVIYLYITIK